MTARRKSANACDYPEHLNPFHEEDNHTRLRFWTVTKKKTRSNSFSFQSIKDFRGSISRSLSIRNKNKNSTSSLEQTSQVENDEVQLRVSPSVRQPTESYSASQRLSVTPLPRSRFHERVRNSENPESAKPESPASTPTDDNNPFSDDTDEETKETLRPHSPSKPATPARKKKRAPPPPPVRQSSLKAKSLTDYKASKQIESNKSVSTEEKITQNGEIETISIDNNVNIHIKVEEVTLTDSNEQNETTVTVEETKISVTEEVNSNRNESTVNNQETTHNVQVNKVESTHGNTSVEEQQKPEQVPETADEISAISETTAKIPPVSEPAEEIPPVSEQAEETFGTETIPISVVTNTEESINFNSEVTISSSHSSLSSDTKLEQLEHELQHNAIQDTSDLLDLVNKLKLEVDKLTDDTNNNVVETEEERKARNIESWIKLDSPNRVKTEINVYLDKKDDDDDVVCSAPMSPRVRLRKDSDWIRLPN